MAHRKVGLVFLNLLMADQHASEVIKRLLGRLDLNYLSYVGYPADEDVPYPEGFLEGYHKCIDDLTNEIKRLGFDLRLQCNQEAGKS